MIRRRAVAPVKGLSDSPLLDRIYAARGITSAAVLDTALAALPPPDGLKGIDPAVDLLATAVQEQWRITIVADLDADGATSCALAMRALHAFGAAPVNYVVPNRFLHGYGLTPEIVDVARQFQPRLLVTVDNGMSGHAGVDKAHALGMRVLITDHHLPSETLPRADALVNPHQPGDTFPGKALAGVGVIFYVLVALRKRLRAIGWFTARRIAEPNMAQFLDLVAVGTVADVVPLAPINRILVAQGLQRIRKGQCVPGIKALFHVAGEQRPLARTIASDISFQLAPRLNAAGRLQDMCLSIACLLSDDPTQALEMAQQLDQLNRARKGIEANMQAQGLAILEQLSRNNPTEWPMGLCLYDPSWHQGVVGLLSGKMKDRAHRPVIAFAPDQGDTLRGSGRSIPGLHLRDTLAAINTQHPGLIIRFGGHAAAAGLSIPRAGFAHFQTAFEQQVRRQLSAEDVQGVIWSDGPLTPEELSLETARLLRATGPWGQGFPEPVFDGIFTIRDQRIFKAQHIRWELATSSGKIIRAMAFFQADQLRGHMDKVRIAYHLVADLWGEKESLLLRVNYFELARG